MKEFPTPALLYEKYSAANPEELAVALDYKIARKEETLEISGVIVYSEFRPPNEIIIYSPSMQDLSEFLESPLWEVEQWHIAHELCHGLAASLGEDSWQSSEFEADEWADGLVRLYGIDM